MFLLFIYIFNLKSKRFKKAKTKKNYHFFPPNNNTYSSLMIIIKCRKKKISQSEQTVLIVMLNIIEYNIDNKFVLFFKLTLKMYTVSLKLVKIDFYFEHKNYILLFYIY